MKKLFIALIFCFTYLTAQEIAFVKKTTGQVFSKTADDMLEVKKGDWLNEKMVLLTKDNSEITLIFKDDSLLVLGPNSILILEKYLFEPKNKKYDFQLKLDKGTASFESGDIGKYAPESFQFKTPESAVAIRGTKFIVKVQ